MVTANAQKAYKQNAILTASPEELTFMLYNGLVRFIMIAQKAIEDRDIEKAHDSIIRADDIIIEFRSTLDMQYDLSHGLAMLYEYMSDRLMEANITKDREILEEVLHLAKNLRDTWAQAMKLAKNGDRPVEMAK